MNPSEYKRPGLSLRDELFMINSLILDQPRRMNELTDMRDRLWNAATPYDRATVTANPPIPGRPALNMTWFTVWDDETSQYIAFQKGHKET